MISTRHLFEAIIPESSAVPRVQDSLGITLPSDYVKFIKKYGAIDTEDLSIYGSWIGDIGDDIPSVVGYTKILRKSIDLPENYIAIQSIGNDEILLHTENGYLYQWHEDMQKILPIMEIDSFKEFLESKGYEL